MIDLRNDPRWLRLNDPMFAVGGFRGGIFELDIDRPAEWTGGEPVGGDDDFDPDDFLSADYCIMNNSRFFLRCVVELQIQGSGGKQFAQGCWAEVSRGSFGDYVVSHDPGAALPPPMAAAFANALPGLPRTLGQPCTLRARSGGLRPQITFNDAGHPLGRAQSQGIGLDALLDLYAAAGIDLRAAAALTH